MLFLIQYGMETGVNGDNGKNVPRFVEAEHRHAEGAVMTHPRTMGEITALGNPLKLKAAIQNAVSTFSNSCLLMSNVCADLFIFK